MNSHYHSVNLVILLPFPFPSHRRAIDPQDEYRFKRRHLADDPNSSLLEEVHSKIWKKKRLEPVT